MNESNLVERVKSKNELKEQAKELIEILCHSHNNNPKKSLMIYIMLSILT